MAIKVNPPNIVLFNCDGTFSYNADPRNEAIVGKNMAPQNVLVIVAVSDTGGKEACNDCPSGV